MSGLLELRYRWWLRLLPAYYRQRWEEDMAAAFLDSMRTGDPDRDKSLAEGGHPSWREEVSVAALAVRLRLGGAGAPWRYFAWGQAVRRAVLILVLARAVTAARSLLFQAWAHRLLSWVSAPPAHLNVSFAIWPALWYASQFAWMAVYCALVLGYRREARVIAGLATAVDLWYLVVNPVPWPGLLRMEPWAYWLLLDLAPLLAMAAFHRDAPPVPRRRWLLALPAGVSFVAVPLLALQLAGSRAVLLDWPGLYCILIAAGGLSCLSLAWAGRTGPASSWPLTLALLAVVALVLQIASLAGYLHDPRAMAGGAVEAALALLAGAAFCREAVRALRSPALVT